MKGINEYDQPCSFKFIFNYCKNKLHKENISDDKLKFLLSICLNSGVDKGLFVLSNYNPMCWSISKDYFVDNDKNDYFEDESNNMRNKKRSISAKDKEMPVEELVKLVNESRLTNLQILISVSILKSPNNEADLDTILNFVNSQEFNILGKDCTPKSTDPKRAILASLSKNASTNPLFMKGNEENKWTIGPNNVFYGMTSLPDGFLELLAQSKSQSDIIELTELQKIIMKAISLENGYPCPLSKIYEFVKPKYEKLRRRDGSSYATNAKRAIQASLSNNSSNNPIFQPVEGPDQDELYWTLSERGERHLFMIKDYE